MFSRIRSVLAVVLTVILFASASSVAHATYPNRTVRIVISVAPGGAMDNLARNIAHALRNRWQHPVIVEHKPGAGGSIAAHEVARSAPDGYTLLLTVDSLVTATTLFAGKVTYDPIKSFEPISILANSINAIVVSEKSPIKDLKTLVGLSEERPVMVATSGLGLGNHFALIGLQNAVKSGEFQHVPYKGAGPSVVAVLSNETDAAVVAVPAIVGHVRSGQIRVLATIQSPSRALPGVPTVREAGVPFEAKDLWFGLLAPAGTPQNIVAEINAAAAEAIQSAEFSQRLIQQGYEPVGSTAEAFAARLRDDVRTLPPLLKSAGVKMD